MEIWHARFDGTSVLKTSRRVNQDEIYARMMHRIFKTCESCYKLFPADIYLFKVNNKTLELGVKYAQSWQSLKISVYQK